VADNITLNAGSGGATLATDDIGGVQYPIGKTAFGALDSVTLVDATHGLPVQPQTGAAFPVTDNGGSLTVDGTVAVTGTVGVSIVGQTGTVSVGDGGGSLTVDGSVSAAQSGTWTVQPGNTANATPWLTSEQAATAGGCSAYSFISTAAVQAAAVKNAAGQVYGLHFFNNSGTICYVRLYNQTAAPAATDSPVYRAVIPANTSGAGFVVNVPPGIAFSTGIGVRVTAGSADNDATALSAGAVLGNVLYK
jgi:hypothetical protein